MGALKKAAEPLKIKGFAAFNCQRWDYRRSHGKKKGELDWILQEADTQFLRIFCIQAFSLVKVFLLRYN